MKLNFSFDIRFRLLNRTALRLSTNVMLTK